MGRRSTKRKTPAVDLVASPPPETVATPESLNISGSESPKEFNFNFNTARLSPPSSMKKRNYGGGGGKGGASSSSMFAAGAGVSSPLRGINSISDLKELASSRLESIKRQLERSHSEIMKDFDASQCRLQKRSKLLTQGCQQVIDEGDREYKTMYDRIEESREAMKASFTEFLAEAQASAARLCKTSIPELSKTVEKSINSLRSRYGIS